MCTDEYKYVYMYVNVNMNTPSFVNSQYEMFEK